MKTLLRASLVSAAIAVFLVGSASFARDARVPAPGHPAPSVSAHDQSGHDRPESIHDQSGHDQPESINWTDFSKPNQPPFIALAINAAILFGLYYWKGKKPIAEGLKNRRIEIAKEIEEAARLKAAAEERAKVYQAKLGQLDQELATAREALLKAGEAERDRAVAEAKEKANRMRRDAEFMVEQELKQLRVDLQIEAAAAAVFGAEELLKKRLTPADHERLAEEYLSDLSKLTAGAGVGGAA